MKNGEQPAHPTIDTIHPATGERFEPINLGLTKREYFAGLAMQSIFSKWENMDNVECAKRSVKMADELLKQLETN